MLFPATVARAQPQHGVKWIDASLMVFQAGSERK